jgi:hypothetical protein
MSAARFNGSLPTERRFLSLIVLSKEDNSCRIGDIGSGSCRADELCAMNALITKFFTRRKILLLAIAIWLAAGTTAGFLLGAADNKKGLNAVAANNTDIRIKGTSAYLVYSCDNADLVLYDIDHARMLSVQMDVYGPPESVFRQTYTYALSVLGSGGSLAPALTYVKPVARSLGMSKSQRVRFFIAGAIALVSGVSVGYRVGSRKLPNCDDPQILEKIRQQAYWKQAVDVLANDLWTQAEHLANLNGTVKDQSSFLNFAHDQILSGRADSKLFIALRSEIKDRYVKYEQNPRQLTWVEFLILAASIMLVAGLLLFVFPTEHKAKSRKSEG